MASNIPPGLLRDRGHGETEVRPVELFFDLVYVLAVTQLTQTLLHHLSVRGAIESLLLLLAVWAAWNYTTWTANYFEPNARPVRVAMFALMLASLVMSASLPKAFAEHGLFFAAAYVALTIGRTLLVLAAVGSGHHLTKVFGRPDALPSGLGYLNLANGTAFVSGLALSAAVARIEAVAICSTGGSHESYSSSPPYVSNPRRGPVRRARRGE